MKNSLVVLLFILPGILCAQTEGQSGIRFENLPNWNAVLAKAKQENKYIFVDCFATWCGPCKRMDKEIYPIDSIGKFYNEHFLPVKVQMDSTAQDNELVRSWYADARQLQRVNAITAFPSYLFFSPDGKLVHKNIGFMGVKSFSNLAHYALDPKKQYYTLRENFRQGTMAFADMPDLVRAASHIQDTATANAVSKDYINNYLLQLPEKEFYTVENIVFISDHIQSSADKGFKIFYTHADKIDSAVKTKNYSRNNVDIILEREEINKILYKDGKPFNLLTGDSPDWDKIHHTIKKKYNSDYADRVVLWAKILWVEYKKNWPEYCKNVILKVSKYGPYDKYRPYFSLPDHYKLNASAWELFQYSTNQKELELALEWSDKAIKTSPTPDPEYLDTYANLLYKMGKTEEALSFEEKALALNPKAPGVADNLAKIKKGEPTWPTN